MIPRRRQRLLSLLGLTAVLLETSGCHQSTIPASAPSLVTVATVEPVGVEIGPSSRFTGTVRPYRQVEVSFRVSGYVQSLLTLPGASGSRPVQAGDSVTAGMVLARIASTDYQAHADAVRATVTGARANVDEARSKHSQAVEAIVAARAALAVANENLGAARAQHDEAVTNVNIAAAAVADAETNSTIAKTTVDRVEGLYHSGSATRPEFDAAKANYDSASAKLLEVRGALEASRERVSEASAQMDAAGFAISAAKANVVSSKTASTEATNAIAAANAQVSQAQAMEAAQNVSVSDTSLRAPIAGTVIARRVDVGSLVAPGTPAFSIAETSRMKVVFGIPETVAAQIHVGEHVDLTVGAERSLNVKGAVSDIAPVADEHTGVFDVEVTIPNSDRRVRVGMLSTLSIPGSGSTDETVAAPISAVVQSHNNPAGYAVVTVANDGGRTTAHYRDVQLGATYGDSIVVRGVRRGDIVVTSGPALLYDGQQVEVTHSGPGAG